MSMSSRAALLTLLGLSFTTACEERAPAGDSPHADLGDSGTTEPLMVPEAARVELARTGQTRLLVELAPPSLPQLHRGLSAPDQTRVRSVRRATLGEEVRGLMASLPTGALLAREYDQIPLVTLDLTDARALDALADNPRVVGLHLDERLQTTLDSSLPLISQPEAEDSGFTGEGTAVAVLDTGLDYTHADFGSCTAVGTPASCKVVAAVEIADEDGERDDHGHGTNVAAIVGGVAPGADLIGIDVFESDGYAYTSDIVAAIDWVVENADDYNIVALNMSLGGGRYYDTCSYSAYELAISIASNAGVASAVATGNDGWTDSISSPACAPSAIKVGAVYSQAYSGISWSSCSDTGITADQVTCFSNSASFVDLLAPGAIIEAGGYRMGGTSQATPHVAGALAVVAEAYPSESPEDWLDRLQDTGETVNDTRNSLSFARIDVGAAVEDAAEGDAPSVSLTLDSGATFTSGRVVNASLAVTDGTGAVTEMCLANADDSLPTACTDWETIDSDLLWQTSTGQGDKTVAVWVRDAAGRTSEPGTASIQLDTIAPLSGELTATVDDGTIALSWSAGTDTGSGVSQYTVAYAAGSTAPSDCDDGAILYEGADLSTALDASGSYAFRLCVSDAAGNLTVGDTTTVAADGSIEGTLTIDGGAEWTAQRAVQLSLSANGATEMCLSNTLRCADDGWRTFEPDVAWSLPDTQGERTVTAWFRAADGTSSEAASDTITIDNVAPEPGQARARARMSDDKIVVNWAGFSDETSGIAGYRVHATIGTASPSTCRQTAELTTPGANRTVLDRTVLRRAVKVVVCAEDNAGNMSVAATAEASPQ